MQSTYSLPPLPPPGRETRAILLSLNQASRSLGELKGEAKAIRNQRILINNLLLREAMASSAIEGIAAQWDELLQIESMPSKPGGSSSANEVARCRDTLLFGFESLRRESGIIPNSLLAKMFRRLKLLEGGYRSVPGTALRSGATGKIVYVPPQAHDEIAAHMTELERFINDDEICGLDPLIKMALIHHQFESIHPFPDGNGCIGRMLNLLYLLRTGLLDVPILPLSCEIRSRRADYYRLLQAVRTSGAWEEWVIYMLGAAHRAAISALQFARDINSLMYEFDVRLRSELPKLHSENLLDSLFRHPYARIEIVMRDLGVSRQTATTYLKKLAAKGLVTEVKRGRSNYYINEALAELLRKGKVGSQLQA